MLRSVVAASRRALLSDGSDGGGSAALGGGGAGANGRGARRASTLARLLRAEIGARVLKAVLRSRLRVRAFANRRDGTATPTSPAPPPAAVAVAMASLITEALTDGGAAADCDPVAEAAAGGAVAAADVGAAAAEPGSASAALWRVEFPLAALLGPFGAVGGLEGDFFDEAAADRRAAAGAADTAGAGADADSPAAAPVAPPLVLLPALLRQFDVELTPEVGAEQSSSPLLQ